MSGGPSDQLVEDPRYRLQFIDLLFAVALDAGLSQGILQAEWLRDWRPPSGVEFLHFWTFVLGLSTVAVSWVGYHQAVEYRPLQSAARFGVDVCLLLLYILMLIKYSDLRAVVLILAVIYFLYLCWDVATAVEYRSGWTKREWAGVAATIWFTLVAALSAWMPGGLALAIAFIGVILYRTAKYFGSDQRIFA
jgi:hypothetical protein